MDYPQQKQSKILIIGETCIDRYTRGACNRLSPEAPVPVFRAIDTTTKAGMAANVNSNIVSLGQSSTFITNKQKIIKTRLIDIKSKQHVLRVDEKDSCEELNVKDLDDLLCEKYDATIISDYNKGFLSADTLSKIINKLPKPIFVDSKKRDLSPFEGCILKINDRERDLATFIPSNSKLVVTLGNLGAEWDKTIYPAEKIHDVFDVCGAGDTFLAALVVHYCQFKNIKDAVIFANKCASITVQKSGVYSIELEDIL